MTIVRYGEFYYGDVAVTDVEICRFYDGRVERTVVEDFFLNQHIMQYHRMPVQVIYDTCTIVFYYWPSS